MTFHMISSSEKGFLVEEDAAKYLQSIGYEILFRNFRSRYGEIDIIAKKEDILIFFEVRYRHNTSLVKPEESLDRKKIHRLSLAIRDFLGKHELQFGNMRVDLVCAKDIKYPTEEKPSFAFQVIEGILEF